MKDGSEELCATCGFVLKASALFCDHCGRIPSPNLGIECENHSSERAVGFCVICSKPVCGDCAAGFEGRIFCDQVHHQQMHRQWKVVYTTDSEFDADIIEKNLTGVGIACKAYSLRDHLATYWIDDRSVRVMVENGLYERATSHLQSLHLTEHSSAPRQH